MSDCTKLAFPRPVDLHPHTQEVCGDSQEGMSLREYYAGQAMAGLLALDGYSIQDVAKWAIKQADELIKQLEETA